MQNQKQKSLTVKEFKKPLVYGDSEIPQPGPGQVQIKMIASTINPSDKIMTDGQYWRTQPNFIAGLEGFGEVIKAGDNQGESLVGKKVSFNTIYGTWAEYSVANLQNCWIVEQDVPVESAASGVINPLTVLGFVDTYKKSQNRGSKGKGIINTAAASALGRMLNKLCQKEGIPLLNIVRRSKQVKILQEEGAKYVINTSDENWLQQYKEAIKTHEFNRLFDAIGGGQISDKLISNLPRLSMVYFYGKFSSDDLVITKPVVFSGGVQILPFSVFEWLQSISKKERQEIQKNFSSLLKKELSTNSIQRIKLQQVPKYFEEADKRATEGKFTILI